VAADHRTACEETQELHLSMNTCVQDKVVANARQLALLVEGRSQGRFSLCAWSGRRLRAGARVAPPWAKFAGAEA
jgi:hypothetical protein